MSTRPSTDNSDRRNIHRIGRACDECRRRKVRCSGLLPTCHRCKSHGIECNYKNPIKKRGPSKESLENRLHKMEALISTLVTENQSMITLEDSRSPEDDHSTPLLENDDYAREYFPGVPLASQLFRPKMALQAHSPSASSSSSVSSVDELSKGLENLAIIDRYGYVRYYGNASGLQMFKSCPAFRHRYFDVQDRNAYARYQKLAVLTNSESQPEDPPPVMPPPDQANHLIDLYFTNFYPVLPILHKASFLKSLKDPQNPPSPLLLNAIFAIASRISTDERVIGGPESYLTVGNTFFERAKILLDKDNDKINISTIQALLLLSSHQYGSKKGNRAWLYNGMAFRMVQNLGLNRDCDHWDIPLAEREERKRLFWCCYIVDRITSAAYGRPITLDDRECDVTYPIEEDDLTDGSMPILDYMRQYIKLCRVIGALLQDIYSVTVDRSTESPEEKVSAFHARLHEWKVDLPRSLQYEPQHNHVNHIPCQPSLAVCQLHMAYHTSLILLHRPYISLSQPRNPDPSLQICLSASYNILTIAETLSNEQRLCFVLNYCVFDMLNAGGVFVSLATSTDARISLEAKASISKLMRALQHLDVSWGAAARFGKLFGDVSNPANQLHTVNSKEKDNHAFQRLTVSKPPAKNHHYQRQVPYTPQMQKDETKMGGGDASLEATVHNTPSSVLGSVTYPSDGNDTTLPTMMNVAEWESIFGSNPSPSDVFQIWQNTNVESMDIISFEDLLEL